MPRFDGTPDLTVGVEEELQLVDPEHGNLVDRPDELTEQVAASEGRLQTEVFRSTVETTTPICEGVDELAEEMRRLRGRVGEATESHGLTVAASGTHPFAAWEAEATSRGERYEELLREVRLPVRRDLVFGQHVHVAVGSTEEAIRVTNDLAGYLPLLLALSVNAPFWRGIDSGLQSARTNVSECMPRSGLPPRFSDWDEFQRHVDLLRETGSIEDVTKIWWDVRPRPDLGTIEVRVADLPTEVETSAALAALTYALVVHLAERHRAGRPALDRPSPAILRENRWRAARDGLDAEFIPPEGVGSCEVRNVDEALTGTVDELDETIERLGAREQVDRLRSNVRRGRSEADRQRLVHEKDGDLSAVVRDLAHRTPP